MSRILWVAMLVVGVVALGVSLAFLISGPEMIFLAVVFGGAGVFLTLEALPRVLGWER